MKLKTLQDWVLTKQLKSVPDVIDVAVFGGTTREYQVQVDPNKLIAYGLNIGQVEQALANNNINAGGSFIERGEQAINVRAVGLVENSQRHRRHRAQDAERHSGARARRRNACEQGPKIRLGQLGKAIHPRAGQGDRRSRRGVGNRPAAQGRRRRRRAGWRCTRKSISSTTISCRRA